MKKFAAKDIRKKFIEELVKTNLDFVKQRLAQNRALSDAFYDFSQKEGFTLEAIVSNQDNFKFFATLSPGLNAEENNGEIVFTKEDFEKAVKEASEQILELPEVDEQKSLQDAVDVLEVVSKFKKFKEKKYP
jgi:hypothetical protein